MASVLISYSSLEQPFIQQLLHECMKFSDDIVVTYGDTFFNGTPQDHTFIDSLITMFPTIKFVKYIVDLSVDPYLQSGIYNNPSMYWFCYARYVGVQYLRPNRWVFVIDADEIPDGDTIHTWLQYTQLNTTNVYKMASYWYFKSPIFQSTSIEDSPLLIHSSHLTEHTIFGDNDRDSIIQNSKCINIRNTKAITGSPMFHHFSWVRRDLKQKIICSAHIKELNKTPNEIMTSIYKNDEVNDIIHNYTYIIVDNKFNIIL